MSFMDDLAEHFDQQARKSSWWRELATFIGYVFAASVAFVAALFLVSYLLVEALIHGWLL